MTICAIEVWQESNIVLNIIRHLFRLTWSIRHKAIQAFY